MTTTDSAQQVAPAARCPRGCCASYREHLQGIRLNVTSPQTLAMRQDERDMHAYKRLTQSGVQPKAIAGAHELERGGAEKFEVENASIITNPAERRKLARAFETAEAHKPSTTPLAG